MKHFNANGMVMSQILGFSKPREERGQLLSNGQMPDQVRHDVLVGEEVQVKADLSIPAQVNTSFVPYITSVGKQCLQPMAYGIKLIALLFFVFHPFVCFQRMMKNRAIRICVYGFVSLLFNNAALAQSHENGGAVDGVEEIRPLQIGDTIPDELWNAPLQVVNHPEGKEIITLNDYKGKLIILDFWATWCGSCIVDMPHMHEIADSLGNGIVLLPITTEDNSRVRKFLETSPVLQQMPFSSITSGSTVLSYFLVPTIPHLVIVDTDGTIKSFTMPKYLSSAKLSEAILTGEKTWLDKFDHTRQQIFPLNSSYTSGTPFYAVFSGPSQGLERKIGIAKDSISGVKRFYASNVPLRLLLTRAAGKAGVPRAFIDIGTEVDRAVLFDSVLTYEATFPIDYSDAKIQMHVRNDVQRYVGYSTEYEDRSVECWIVYSPQGKVNDTNPALDSSTTVGLLVRDINSVKDFPPLQFDESSEHYPVPDMAIDHHVDFGTLRQFLTEYGLDLRKEVVTLPILSVYKTNTPI